MEAKLVANLEKARDPCEADRCLDEIGSALSEGKIEIEKLTALCPVLGKWLTSPLVSTTASALLALLVMQDSGYRRRLCDAGVCSSMLRSATEKAEPAHLSMLFRATGFLACDHLCESDAGEALWGALDGSLMSDLDCVAEAVGILCALGHGGRLTGVVAESANATLVRVALRHLAHARGAVARGAVDAAVSALRFGDRDTLCCVLAFMCHVAECHGVELTAPQAAALANGLDYPDVDAAFLACSAVSRLGLGARAVRRAGRAIALLFMASGSALCLDAMEALLYSAGAGVDPFADLDARAFCASIVEAVGGPDTAKALGVVATLSSSLAAYRSELGRLGACEAVSSVAGHARLVREATAALCEGDPKNAARMSATGTEMPSYAASAA